MEFKIVGRQNASENQENVTESIRQSDIPQQESQVIHSEIRYENPKLIRRDGVYYIGYENDLILIEEWEAEEVAKPAEYDEGCLSFPDIFCNVVRPDKVCVRFFDINGEPQEIHNCEGLFARCIQHESDHLNGDLFVDKISTADRTMNQSKLRKMAKETQAKLKKGK